MSSSHPAPAEIEYVPLGKITVFAVTEAELLEIKKGSADSVLFAWGVACVFLFVPTVLTMLILPTENQKVFSVYLAVAILSGVLAIVLLSLWRKHRSNTHSTIEIIIARKPPAGIQAPNSPLPPAMGASQENA